MLTDEILFYLFEDQPHLLTEPMTAWLAASRQFAAFVTAFRDKIRKKLRVTPDQESLLDLRLELETAYLLLQERRLKVDYEPQQADQSRSPDFAVTFTTSMTFMVEVTRLRAGQNFPAADAQEAAPQIDERFIDSICSKLGQLLPQHSNVLIVGADAASMMAADLQNTMIHLQQRVESDDLAFWRRYRFRDRAGFFRQYQRLSEILVRQSDWPADNPTAAWINPQAKQPLPKKVRAALYRSHAVS
jgi:hypothetical protein